MTSHERLIDTWTVIVGSVCHTPIQQLGGASCLLPGLSAGSTVPSARAQITRWASLGVGSSLVARLAPVDREGGNNVRLPSPRAYNSNATMGKLACASGTCGKQGERHG